MPIVEVKGVSKIYHQGKIIFKALDNVSLSIGTGEFTALAGPSGSGKTTLLNLIGGLDLPDSGRVILDGHDYRKMSDGKRADLRLESIGFVFQSYNLIPVLTAAENVEFILRLQKVSKPERLERVRTILDEVGLQGRHNSRPDELSGGQQQRVAVARAIVSNPSVVLADEPTANLDSKTGEKLLDLMKKMNEERQVTFIFATHDRMVMDFAERIISLHDGKVADDRQKR
ncbi:MAG: macrolide ABC transporter ATP-binding protein [Desulfobulbaceae bacterium S3730MH12]|nr:MAG: macrolide ABC transporter ATP-binding protein [Desulfobulbaceae bacterium S5133MH15]OEU58108.1 MAG: macrolide ABC transporter ATP-binding protein [Desulfobulbaceae bacterium S3730MH12]OEU78871.1 MAG: macrolide ABC transporter ATP-binding protein [Desulfobulbaceae bacterium C00003063]